VTIDSNSSILRRAVAVFAAAVFMLGVFAARARAEDPGADPPRKVRRRTTRPAPERPAGPSAERRLEELTGDVSNLRKSEAETSTAVEEIRKAMAVKEPAENAQPTTIGEHVGALEKQLSDTRKNLADNLGVHIHGLVDAGYIYNLNQPNTTGGLKGGANPADFGGRVNQLRDFDIDANSFQLTQFNLHIDRTVESGLGFVTDINFGKTAEVLRSATRYSNSSGPSTDQIDPTQAYATYTVPVGNGINLSAGKFVTLLGAEVIPVYNNFDYNESKGILFGFAIPFTHTGVRAQYSFTNQIGLTLGVNNGWDDVSDNNSGKSVEGQISLTPTDALAMTLTGMYGPEQVNHGNSKRGIIDPIVTWKTPISGVTLVGEYLYAHEDGPVSTSPIFSSQGNSLGSVIPHGVDWQGAAGYVIYDLNDKIEFATRGEYFRDSDGVRTGIRQTLGEITETLNYKVASGLLARFEYRHDESNARPFFSNTLNPATDLPFQTYSGQDTFEAAAIYAF
jgi:Putative beta-barrel porin-2, OmpL-like. bbp2